SKVEMGKWIEDLNLAIDMAKKSQEKSSIFLDAGLSDRSNRSSDEVSLEQESEDDMNSSRTSLDKQTHHRANTTMHVCWHRNTSVSMSDHSLAVEVLLPCPQLHANTAIYIHQHAHDTHQQHVRQTSHLHTSISGVSGNGFAFCFL
ncbi:FERM, ARHGEF and pleckstrin domain-containing protein 1-like, partial [Neolamprologus brichardi]|uniref:FERM, ARHGEF and pleckstrin domain-containing protein 1-like n=1 Tax=Neolamprologus brichardi TaxID=32507 RepID=UPI001643F847